MKFAVSVMLSVFLMFIPVYAQDVSVAVGDGSALSGELIAFYIAEEGDSGYTSFIEGYEVTSVSEEAADEVLSSYSVASLDYVTANLQDDGTAVFEGLENGIYLIAANGIIEDENGVEYDFDPYLLVVTDETEEVTVTAQTIDEIEESYFSTKTEEETDISEEDNIGLSVATALLVIATAAVLAVCFSISSKMKKKDKRTTAIPDDLMIDEEWEEENGKDEIKDVFDDGL